MAVLITATMFAQVPTYVPNNGLLGWWPFTGSANDLSGNGNNGTVNGATLTTDRFGLSNQAYNFNGVSNYIQIDSSILNNVNLSHSISFWFNAGYTGHTIDIINDRFGSSYDIKYRFSIDSINQGRLTYFNYKSPGTSNQILTPTVINNNQWYNAILTYDQANSKAIIYINGIVVDSLNAVFLQNTNSNPTTIGRLTGPVTHYYFNGEIDDIGMWNRALTQQEITNLYTGNICIQNITVTDTLLINTTITGFNPITYQNTIKVYPNPTHDHITIDNGNIANLTGYQLKIVNSLGVQVFSSPINTNQFYIDLSTWTGNGIYFIHIINASGATIDIKKIIIQ